MQIMDFDFLFLNFFSFLFNLHQTLAAHLCTLHNTNVPWHIDQKSLL
jgi:hypothetical protein